MAGALVLITGANGALGYPVVLHALKAGFQVRAAVRSQSKADLILNAPSVQALDAATKAKLSFTIVSDLLQKDAYKEALKSVVFAIHVASPIPSDAEKLKPDDFEAAMITPAIQGTMNMLETAERTPSVRRVVITSSVVAQVPLSVFAGPATGQIYTEASRTPDPSRETYAHERTAYLASKILALNAAERWMNEKKRRISIVHVHPSLILGRIELATTEQEMLKGSSGRALGYMLNKPGPNPLVSNTCWVEDVAEVHVRALDEERIVNGQSLVVQSDAVSGIVWADAKKIVERKFPKAVAKGVLPNDGWPETKVFSFDVAETERLVGMKFTGFKRQVEDIAEQYLELVGAEKA